MLYLCDPPESPDSHAYDCDCPTCAPHEHHPAHVLAAALCSYGFRCSATIDGAITRLEFVTERGARSSWRLLTGYSTMDVALDGLVMMVAPLGTFVEQAMAATGEAANDVERRAA